MIYNSRTYSMTVSALCNAGRLLPAGELKQEQKPAPELVTKPDPVTMVWANFVGYWQQWKVVGTSEWVVDGNIVRWVCLDVTYGVRWIRKSQIDQWQSEHQQPKVKAA